MSQDPGFRFVLFQNSQIQLVVHGEYLKSLALIDTILARLDERLGESTAAQGR